MHIRLEKAPFGCYVIRAETGASLLVQIDWDFVGLASSFGWVPCFCGETDGTVDCPHHTAADMLAEARTFLDEHIGERVEDPGYFAEECR